MCPLCAQIANCELVKGQMIIPSTGSVVWTSSSPERMLVSLWTGYAEPNSRLSHVDTGISTLHGANVGVALKTNKSLLDKLKTHLKLDNLYPWKGGGHKNFKGNEPQ